MFSRKMKILEHLSLRNQYFNNLKGNNEIFQTKAAAILIPILGTHFILMPIRPTQGTQVLLRMI